MFVNTVGFSYSLFTLFWCFWLDVQSPGIDDINWSVAMFVAVLLAATVDYWVRARTAFKGPAALASEE